MDNDYWQKQTPGKVLFDDVLWSKPERRDQAGRLAIVGGNSQGFWAVVAPTAKRRNFLLNYSVTRILAACG